MYLIIYVCETVFYTPRKGSGYFKLCIPSWIFNKIIVVIITVLENWLKFHCFTVSHYQWSGLLWQLSGFGGLEVACWPLVPKFAGSNPAESVGFFRAKKILIAPSFGREVKPSAHVAYLRHLKEPESVCVEVAAFGPNYRPFLAQVVPPSPTRVWWRQLAVQVGTTRDQGLYNGK